MQNCSGSIFHDIYRLCDICGAHRKKDGNGSFYKGDHKCEDVLKQECKDLNVLLRAMREDAELQAASLKELENSNTSKEQEQKATFLTMALAVRP